MFIIALYSLHRLFTLRLNIKKIFVLGCYLQTVDLNLTLDESSIVFSPKTTDSIFYKMIGNFEALRLVSGNFPGVDLRVMSSPPSRTFCFFLLKQPSFSLR